MSKSAYLVLSVLLVAAAAVGCRVSPAPTATSRADTPTAVPPAPTLAPTSTTAPATPTPAPPTATTAPTPTRVPATLEPTSTPGEGPTLDYFRANVAQADPGDTIMLEWRSTGATRATLYHLLRSGQYGSFWEVEPSGSMEYTIPAEARNWEGFQLFVMDDVDRTAQASLTVNLRCPDTWFFSPAPDECPSSPPALTEGAEEHFERGLMLWNGAEDRIYVLFDDGSYPAWKVYQDEWDEGDPESDPSIVPPAGLYQPVRGFGLVWREERGVRDRVGWAVDAETGYAAAIQRTSRFKYNDTYVRALDGGVWKLGPEGSEWRHVP